jgi:hypothetical protein
MDIFKVVRNLKLSNRLNNRGTRDTDFFSDRICHRHTNYLILIFIVVSSLKRLFSAPIHCWIPAELKRYEKYMNKYCWMKGTYYVNQFDDLDEYNYSDRHESVLRYYQWIQIFLLVQAFLFYFPHLLWLFLGNKILSYDLFEIVDAAMKHEVYGNDQEKILKFISSNLTENFKENSPLARRKQNAKIIEVVGKTRKLEKNIEEMNELKTHYKVSINSLSNLRYNISSRLLTFSYFLIKILYLLAALFQVFIMNSFLSRTKHELFGTEIVKTIFRGEADIRNHSGM